MRKGLMFVSGVLLWAMGAATAAPVVLRGTAAVNVTSDTAAAAKNIAMDNARRQIVRDALSPYADRVALDTAVHDAPAATMTNLVASSGIDNEQQSATTYSANITMTLDNSAVRKWLAENNISSWLPDSNGGGQTVVLVTLRDRVGDWMQLNQIARGENIDLNTRNISGDTVTLSIPEAGRAMFMSAARAAGWRASDDAGVFRLWK